MSTAPSSPDGTLMVGSVVESTHTVDMPGIDVVTRSRALRAPWWVVVLVVECARLPEAISAFVQLL